jgi:hypothetical protein
MQETGQLHNKEVYRTVLMAHSCEGHLQYLRSLEADLANAVEDEGEIAASEESVSASTVDTSKEPESEAGADCECLQWGSNTRHFNTRWEIEQTEHPGKYHTLHLDS